MLTVLLHARPTGNSGIKLNISRSKIQKKRQVRDNSSCGKVKFSQASVILSTGGGLYTSQPDTNPLGRHPLRQTPPQADTPQADTPPETTTAADGMHHAGMHSRLYLVSTRGVQIASCSVIQTKGPAYCYFDCTCGTNRFVSSLTYCSKKVISATTRKIIQGKITISGINCIACAFSHFVKHSR